MRKLVPSEELVKIASSLEDYHKVFYTFWQMSSIMYVDDLPTAAVQFVRGAPPMLLLNEKFWNKLSFSTKQFVIVHECSHVILDHFKRNAQGVKGATARLVNVAQDICINEMAVAIFGFDRELDIDQWQKYCWIDTCFKEPSKVLRNQSFLYYLHLLIAETGANGESKSDGTSTVDEHGDGVDIDIEEQERFGGILAQDMDPGDLADILNAGGRNDELGEAGVQLGPFAMVLEKIAVPPKVNFKTITEGLKKTRKKNSDVKKSTFSAENRRFNSVATSTNGLSLPGSRTKVKPKVDKLFVAVFMDVSGSCLSQLDKFHSIIAAFRDEQDIFDCEFYLFDTGIQNITNPKTPVAVGGGTAFHIIERELQTNFKVKYNVYPDAVIIITDGEGNKVEPQYPRRWIWMLTDSHVTTYIHQISRKMRIKDVVFAK
jgi:hypothetical protein